MAYSRFGTNILNFFTALWIFTVIEMYIWQWRLSFSGSSLDFRFGLFFMNSFSNLWHLNYILHYYFMLHTLLYGEGIERILVR